MGDFERTFGAGADAATIVDAYSLQHEAGEVQATEDVVASTAARKAAAEAAGIRCYWRADDQSGTQPISDASRKPSFIAFDASTKAAFGRIFLIDEEPAYAFADTLFGEINYRERRETWAWTLTTERPSDTLPFKIFGTAQCGPEAEGRLLEARRLLIEHKKQRPHYFVQLPLTAGEIIYPEYNEEDFSNAVVYVDRESEAILAKYGRGKIVFAVVAVGLSENSGTVHLELAEAIASFIAHCDFYSAGGALLGENCAVKIEQAFSSLEPDKKAIQTVQIGDTAISITRVMLFGDP